MTQSTDSLRCHGTDDTFDRCWQRPVTVVEHRDGEHLPYCFEHAAAFPGRPKRPLGGDDLMADVERAAYDAKVREMREET